MSGLMVGLVLRHPISEEFNTEAKFVATVYADHAWEDGTHAYPAVGTVAGITGLSDRSVQRYLRVLEGMGMMTLSGKGPRGTNQYSFPLESRQDGSVRLAVMGGDSVSPRQPDGGDKTLGDKTLGDTRVTQTNNPSDVLVVINADAGKIFQAYEQEFGVMTPMISQAIGETIDTYPLDWIPEAMQIAIESNKRSWNYVEGILKNCKTAGKRPSLNRLEKSNGNYRAINSKGKSAGSDSAPVEYSDADRAAAERVRERKASQPVS